MRALSASVRHTRVVLHLAACRVVALQDVDYAKCQYHYVLPKASVSPGGVRLPHERTPVGGFKIMYRCECA